MSSIDNHDPEGVYFFYTNRPSDGVQNLMVEADNTHIFVAPSNISTREGFYIASAFDDSGTNPTFFSLQLSVDRVDGEEEPKCLVTIGLTTPDSDSELNLYMGDHEWVTFVYMDLDDGPSTCVQRGPFYDNHILMLPSHFHMSITTRMTNLSGNGNWKVVLSGDMVEMFSPGSRLSILNVMDSNALTQFWEMM